jgi:hypothetical protein
MMKLEMLLFHLNLLTVGFLNESTCDWDSPIPYPTDEQNYFWNEENQSWTLQNI